MNHLHHDALTNFQDGSHVHADSSWQSIDNNSDYQDSAGLVCLKRGCEHLRFTSKIHHRDHILTHVTLPSIRVPRLAIKQSAVSTKSLDKKHEPLKVRLKLTSQAGSDKPAFEVVRSTNLVLSKPDELLCQNSKDKVNPQATYSLPAHQQKRSSSRGPESSIELDSTTVSLSSEEREQRAHNISQAEDNIFRERENLVANQTEGGEEEDNDDEEEEDDDDEDEEEEDFADEESREDADKTHEEGNQKALNEKNLPIAPLSPTPSEILRPEGFLAPEQLDDDLPFSGSLPVSSARMVEMNGSTSAVSGSDNDSGHSGSPAAFTGGSGAGSGGEEDSSGQQPFNWDELVANSTAHQSSESSVSSGNGQAESSPSAGVDDVAADLTSNSVANSMLDSDPLLLPEAAASGEGEQDNLNLLQNLTADPIQPEDRGSGGETEYMSIERLGLGNPGNAPAALCCEVCGERWQDRRMLEDHRALAGHYKCLMMPECASMVWSTAAELALHQSSIHGQSQSSPQTTSPRISPQAAGVPAPGTPPVQQLAQQVQRLPVPGVAMPQPPQPGYLPNAQYPVPAQMGQMMPQMMPGQAPQRRYRVPMAGQVGPGQQPYGPGSPNIPGAIQPRPLNALVAQGRGQMPGPSRLPPGVMPPRGMVPMQMGAAGQKRPGPAQQAMGQGVPPPVKRRRAAPLQDNSASKKGDASAVANILATRGITVTAAGAGAVGRVGGAQPVRQRVNMPAPAPASAPVATLNLTSAISIIPTSGSGNNRHQAQNNSGFAVPQARSLGRQPLVNTNVERPTRPPTVDLTGEGPVPHPGSTRLQMGPSYPRGRGRGSNLARTTCQICDKVFASAELLNQHMTLHRSPGKLPYRCNLCNAQYPTSQGLQQHRQTYHKESLGMSAPLAPGEEMVIPLVDLKQPGVAARLGSLGIHHCIPLSGLGNQSNGYFSLPVVSIDGSRPGAAGNLRSLGATGVLSIGPIKLVPK